MFITSLPSATKLRRLCFYTCLSFCSQGGLPQCMLGYHPLDQAPPGPGTPQAKYTPPGPGTPPEPGTLPDQAHILGPGTPTPLGPGTPRTRHPPSRRLLLRTVRILLECILFHLVINLIKFEVNKVFRLPNVK